GSRGSNSTRLNLSNNASNTSHSPARSTSRGSGPPIAEGSNTKLPRLVRSQSPIDIKSMASCWLSVSLNERSQVLGERQSSVPTSNCPTRYDSAATKKHSRQSPPFRIRLKSSLLQPIQTHASEHSNTRPI